MNKPQSESGPDKPQQLQIRRALTNLSRSAFVPKLPLAWRRFDGPGMQVQYVAVAVQQLSAFYVQWLAESLKQRKLQAVLSRVSNEKQREEQAGSRGDCCE